MTLSQLISVLTARGSWTDGKKRQALPNMPTVVQDNLDELARRGLIKETFNENGEQCWYIPEDKVTEAEQFIKELDEKESR